MAPMTRKERIAAMLAHAKTTAELYRMLASQLMGCATCLEDPNNTEWSALPTVDFDLMSKSMTAGIVLTHMIDELRK